MSGKKPRGKEQKMEKATKRKETEGSEKTPHLCMEVWKIPAETYGIEDNQEREDAFRKMLRVSESGPFPKNALNEECPIDFLDEFLVVGSLILCLGGPLVWFFCMIAALTMSSWTTCMAAIALSTILAYHPVPSNKTWAKKNVFTSRWNLALYKYFSYKLVWIGDSHEKLREAAPWIGAAPPHGVLPFANILSVPAVNTLLQIDFIGAPASVVFSTPLLRYLTVFPSTPVSGRAIHSAINKGNCVGIVPDGIKGIFCQDGHKEVVALKDRKGIARHALKHGTNVLPAYSFGNTAAFSGWWDSYGILEWLSRKCQVSFFIYWGRFGLPIPRRCQITLVCADPIIVQKFTGKQSEFEAAVDVLHERILLDIQKCFSAHKHALGWGDKELVFV